MRRVRRPATLARNAAHITALLLPLLLLLLALLLLLLLMLLLTRNTALLTLSCHADMMIRCCCH